MEDYSTAVGDFRRARNSAALQELIGRMTGKSTELLSYEEVRRKLRATSIVSRGLQDIPLDAIVGSVSRYNDFTRTFLPRLDSDQDRWASVKVATADMSGLPPIEVYQIGEAYFVHDGHHRISVARQYKAKEVQAYVTEVKSRVPLSAEIRPEDLIISAEYVEFLSQTKLDELRPDIDLAATCPGQYCKLSEHIEVHRHYMGLEQQREIPYEEAVTHWYDTVYCPVIDIIRDLGILYDFPGRTETDLYLWIAKHRVDIEERLGWEIPYSAAAIDLVEQESSWWTRIASRIGRRGLQIDPPEGSPLEGSGDIEDDLVYLEQTSRKKSLDITSDRLFVEILVGIGGEESSWLALEQAIAVARREEGHLQGLYVIAEGEPESTPEIQEISDRFYWRCGEVGLPGRFAVDCGSVAKTICDRARWSDLVVVNVAHPPEDSALSRWGSGFRSLIRRCSRPVLAVPEMVTALSRPILAYDDSPKAQEALYVATYLCGRWQLPLNVVHVTDNEAGNEILDVARNYLKARDIEVEYVLTSGPVAETLLAVAEELAIDFYILGGYGGNPIVEVVLGSVVDTLLGSATKPLLICR
jgi:nucleotide-binding universal stress UspA family protein